jgi:hypothetical protein
MEHSPWEAKVFSASQKVPRILWKPKVHYRSHNFPPLVLILSQLDPVHSPTLLLLLLLLLLFTAIKLSLGGSSPYISNK